MAVFAVLAVSPAMAWERDYDVIDSGQTTNSDLLLEGTKTNRIETGIGNIINWKDVYHRLSGTHGDSFTVETAGNVEMRTTEGVNIIAGNGYELRGTLETVGTQAELGDYWMGFLVPSQAQMPTVIADGNVDMKGAANAVMLGSIVEGQNITMTTQGAGLTDAR